MSITCGYCGTPLPEGAKVCPACGGPVSENKQPSMVIKRQLITPQIGKNAQKPSQPQQPRPVTRQSQPVQIQTPQQAYVPAAGKKKKSHKGVSVFLALLFLCC